jgi:hypothetical protein
MRKISLDTSTHLLQIFWPDFVDVDGSVFLAWEKPKAISDPEHGLDRTGMEVFVNHTHMIDLFHHEASRQPIDENDERFYDNEHPDFLLMCQLGKKLAEMWLQKLKADFPQYDFRVYYTQEDNPVVRFHRIRLDEPNWLEEVRCAEDIEHGRIIIYDTRYEFAKRGGV